jgi:hypothetical protein
MCPVFLSYRRLLVISSLVICTSTLALGCSGNSNQNNQSTGSIDGSGPDTMPDESEDDSTDPGSSDGLPGPEDPSNLACSEAGAPDSPSDQDEISETEAEEKQSFASDCSVCCSDSGSSNSFVIQNSESAQLNGLKGKWNTPITDSRRFDAVHRRLLVRFPNAAKRISDKLEDGGCLQRIELLLPFKQTEVFPKGYEQRSSFNVDKKYRDVRPRWHAIAWGIKKPWRADSEIGPTFNSAIKGSKHWDKPGAEGMGTDRVKGRFGPTEVSIFQARDLKDPMTSKEAQKDPWYHRFSDKQPGPDEAVVGDDESIEVAAMDITGSVTDEAFGETVGQRLRRLADKGFVIRKWETYDFRYRGSGSYPWAASTGGRAIEIQKPRLRVVLNQSSESQSVDLPEPVDVQQIAANTDPEQNKPPLAMPSDSEIQKRLDEHGFRRRGWMTDWQWERLKELREHGGAQLPSTVEDYKKWVSGLLKQQPRYWAGWDNAQRLLEYQRLSETLPKYVRKHAYYDYWNAWLQPDTPQEELVHPQARVNKSNGNPSAIQKYAKSFDWRGSTSFYRGYLHGISTMNFNHTSAIGALLGGEIVGSKYAIKDGRHGLENFPLKTWSWRDGSTQESIDHYYFALTLVAQKMFADYGPARIDRMMGESILAKSIEELTSAFHPNLKRFLASSTRTGVPDYLIGTQDGTQHIMHSLSKEGAILETEGEALPDDLKQFGNDVPPAVVQEMAMDRPWGPPWLANIVDDKPIPYRMTNAYKVRWQHNEHPLWRRTFLSKHYGLASTDITKKFTVQILGHWKRDDGIATHAKDIGTMDVRYGVNGTELADNGGGNRPPTGTQATLQHDNKMIVSTSPQKGDLKNKSVETLASTVAFYNFETPEPSWDIYVGGEPIESLPVETETGEKILIDDGRTFIALIPLPATDLGNSGVKLHRPEPQKSGNTGVKTQAALAVENFNLRGGGDLSTKEMNQAHGGWVIEYGDTSQFDNFDAFRQHINKAQLKTDWNGGKTTQTITYSSGNDTMKMGVNTMYEGGSTDKLFTNRTVNGEWPYLDDKMDRNTSLTQQGRKQRLSKNGADLVTDSGKQAYLQTEPKSGTYVGYNPFPQLSVFRLKAPNGARIHADGKLGLTRAMIRPEQNLVRMSHVFEDDQSKESFAARVGMIFGFEEAPRIRFNGDLLPSKCLETVQINGQKAWVFPLQPSQGLPESASIRDRYERLFGSSD